MLSVSAEIHSATAHHEIVCDLHVLWLDVTQPFEVRQGVQTRALEHHASTVSRKRSVKSCVLHLYCILFYEFEIVTKILPASHTKA
jgi:hypothetical protein